jgi:hypothetical protein
MGDWMGTGEKEVDGFWKQFGDRTDRMCIDVAAGGLRESKDNSKFLCAGTVTTLHPQRSHSWLFTELGKWNSGFLGTSYPTSLQ